MVQLTHVVSAVKDGRNVIRHIELKTERSLFSGVKTWSTTNIFDYVFLDNRFQCLHLAAGVELKNLKKWILKMQKMLWSGTYV